jgi:hypothetical protein
MFELFQPVHLITILVLLVVVLVGMVLVFRILWRLGSKPK